MGKFSLVAERYLKIAQLLDPQNKRVSTLAEEVHAEKTALSLVEGLSPEKLKSLEESEDFLEPNPGLSPEQTVFVLIDRYNISRDKGQYNLAYQLCRRACLIARRHLPSDRPVTLTARFCYAQILFLLGRHGEALKEIENILPIQERVLPQDHPDTLVSRHLRTQILSLLGRYGEALKEIEDVISIRERILPKDHPETLSSRSLRARILNNLDQNKEALQEIEDVISIRERILPKDHPDTAAAKALRQKIIGDMG